MKILKSRITPIQRKTLAPAATERIRGREGARIRERVLNRDGYLCVLCKDKGIVKQADVVDHIIPLHVGGLETDLNRQSICDECHRIKSEKEQNIRDGK